VALINVLHLQSAVAEAQRRRRRLTPIASSRAGAGALRDNLARVPANSDLQRRYLATLDKQETESRRSTNAAPTPKAIEAAREALRTYVRAR